MTKAGRMQACKRWHGLGMAQHAGKGGSTAESKKTVGYILDLAGPRTATIATDPLPLLPPP